MRIVFLSAGTILAMLYIVLSFAGKKYDSYLEPLDGDAFPLKCLYGAGFALQDIRPFALKGKLGGRLYKEMALYYSDQYSVFYAKAVWAQVLSMSHICLTVFFLLAGLFGSSSTFYGCLGIIAAALVGYYFLNYTTDKIKSRREECEREFPNAISKLALLVNSGGILRDAWKTVAFGKEGLFYDMMRASCVEMENGKSDIDAIYQFGQLTDSQEIKKFTTTLIQSIEKGGGELPGFLAGQSAEIWNHKRQLTLQKGEKAAGALLAPIGIMFAGIMFIVLAAAMQSFSL